MSLFQVFNVFSGDDIDLLIQNGNDLYKLPELFFLCRIELGKVFSDELHELWLFLGAIEDIQEQFSGPEKLCFDSPDWNIKFGSNFIV